MFCMVYGFTRMTARILSAGTHRPLRHSRRHVPLAEEILEVIRFRDKIGPLITAYSLFHRFFPPFVGFVGDKDPNFGRDAVVQGGDRSLRDGIVGRGVEFEGWIAREVFND